MPRFETTDNVDPLLRIRLNQGESVFAESNAMVSMDSCLSLRGKARGGFLSSLSRKFLNDESFFQQELSAENGPGEALLSPVLPGSIRLLEVGERTYMLSDGSYLASDSTVEIETKSQGLFKAGLSGTGGFFIMHARGTGTVAVSGFGSLTELTVEPGKPVTVNNGHVIAWDASLEHSVELAGGSTSFLGKLVNSQTTGTGFVLKFSGSGKVIISSRNRLSFTGWLARMILPTNNK